MSSHPNGYWESQGYQNTTGNINQACKVTDADAAFGGSYINNKRDESFLEFSFTNNLKILINWNKPTLTFEKSCPETSRSPSRKCTSEMSS